MIVAAHAILYADDPDAARAFFRDVLDMPNVDAHGGWLIFKLPPAELGVHPAGEVSPGGHHELFLLCDDVDRHRRGPHRKGRGVFRPGDGTALWPPDPGCSCPALARSVCTRPRTRPRTTSKWRSGPVASPRTLEYHEAMSFEPRRQTSRRLTIATSRLCRPDPRTAAAFSVMPEPRPLQTRIRHSSPRPRAGGLRFVTFSRPGYAASTAPSPAGRSGRRRRRRGRPRCVRFRFLLVRRPVRWWSCTPLRALRCFPDRVLATASLAGVAPWPADGLDWFGRHGTREPRGVRREHERPAALEPHSLKAKPTRCRDVQHQTWRPPSAAW